MKENFTTICFETLKTLLRAYPKAGVIKNCWLSDYHDFKNVRYNKETDEIVYTELDHKDEETEEKDLFMLNDDEILAVVVEVVDNYEYRNK